MSLSNIALLPNLQKAKVRYGLSFLVGALMLFTYAPFTQAWLAPLLLAGWFLQLVRSQNAKQAALTGFFFGLGWFGTGVSWVFVSIDRFGGLPLLATFVIMLLLFSYLALYPSLAAWLWFKVRRKLNRYALLAFPFIWLITEFLRGWLFTGFPWLGLGYTQTTSQFAAFAPHIGEVGLGLIVLLIALSFTYVALTKRLEWLALPVLLYALALLAPLANPMAFNSETVRVALVQGNIEQELKWNPEQEWPSFLTYQQLSEPFYDQTDLIVWPESAITFLEPLAQTELKSFAQQLQAEGTTLISGIIDFSLAHKAQIGDEEYYNSMIVLGDEANPYHWQNSNRYQKHHLLPIGEFVPFASLLRPLAPLFNLPMSSFSRGMPLQPNLQVSNQNIAANICYEVAYSNYLRKQISPETNLLLSISNDTWFGRSHGPHQHFDIARMRALEFGRPLLRAANNGITAIIDHQGHSLQRIPQFTAAVASATIPLVTGQTWYRQFGVLPAWIIASLLLGVSLRRRKHGKI